MTNELIDITDKPRPLSQLFDAGTSPEYERLVAEYRQAAEARDGQTAVMGKAWRKAEKAYAEGNRSGALAAIKRWVDLLEQDRAFEQAQNLRATAKLREKLRVLTETWKEADKG